MIVIFGGAFNPPTMAHCSMAGHIVKTLGCRKLLFLPVGDLYQKPGLLACAHRIKMLELLCLELPRCEVSPLEAGHSRVLSTLETCRLIKKAYPKEEVAFVMGADNLADLPNWFQYEDLLKEFRQIVFKRGDFSVLGLIEGNFFKYRDRFILLDPPGGVGHISSTAYRNHLENEGMVPSLVSGYIKKHHLYGR